MPASAVASPSPATDNLPAVPADNAPADVPAKISAYYSLVFPNITFFLQTLTVTIGRRCLPPTSASLNGTDGPSSTQSPVDVDLGPLKSVSRLHARIEYEEEEARFVLVVIGRNGAWVDGVWSGAGSRVPLGERSQIQIASRTFHFVLPPPAAAEDSPSPSSVSSVQRARSPSVDITFSARSPSVDITSISPPSSLPSHSPSPRTEHALPPPKFPRSPDPQLPNSNTIPRTKAPSASTSASSSASAAPTSKKRKKGVNPPPKPDVMPPKPSFTYAQLCYRAIKAMGGKATLQDICGWMMDNFDWYRYNEGAGWENSVRHNLSSGRAFKKMERSTGEHGKGFFWSVDPQHEHTFEEQEARAAAQAQAHSASSSVLSASGKDGSSKGSRRKDKAVPLDPPLKRSVKSGVGPLPPPLTSTPLAFPSRTQAPSPGQLFTNMPRAATTRNLGAVTKSEPADSSQIDSTLAAGGLLGPVASSGWCSGHVPLAVTPTNTSTPGLVSPPSGYGLLSSTAASSSSGSASPFTALPPSVCLPIIVGPVPPSHPASSTPDPPPIILHNNTLILSPVIFSSLAPEQLKALEEMGAQKALEVLQAHIVRYLKERMGKKKRKKAVTGAVTEKAGAKTGKGYASERSSPFTTIPLPSRAGQSTSTSQIRLPQGSTTSHPLAQMSNAETQSSNLSDFCTPAVERPAVGVKEGVPSSVNTSPPVPVPISDDSRSQTPTIIVVEEDEEGRALKRRKLGNEVGVETILKHEEGATRISQEVDEDIEVDIC